ncbi:uncharacterized protein APUU_21277A [Aspergillus puulaauensis]|uniref:Uncharacterized protein n=1 Tax=Aspergillus puulaauensis TaxID=1220207 RepID=A0A7R8AKL9_9EURO|nr:uncharacterized protein APUU_21277A [Aspergillus puulaauensis]BCS20845.1 hypothetical protein APUU_21277A [Aspergillus puulaauensis]
MQEEFKMMPRTGGRDRLAVLDIKYRSCGSPARTHHSCMQWKCQLACATSSQPLTRVRFDQTRFSVRIAANALAFPPTIHDISGAEISDRNIDLGQMGRRRRVGHVHPCRNLFPESNQRFQAMLLLVKCWIGQRGWLAQPRKNRVYIRPPSRQLSMNQDQENQIKVISSRRK